MSVLTRPFALIYAHRRMLAATTCNDVRARFAGSVIGPAWVVLYPTLLLGAYALVYVFIFKVRLGVMNPAEYVALIFCGLVPFIGFSEALGNGVSSVTGNASLVRNTLFPIDLIPVKSVFTSQATQLVGTAMLLVALAILQRLTPYALLLPVVWLAQILFTIGVIWILSSVNVFARDLQSVVAVLILILMMISPIAYTEEMIPENLRPFLRVNPLYYLIIAYQSCLMLGKMPPPEIMTPLLLVSLGTFVVGYLFFTQLKKVFVDSV